MQLSGTGSGNRRKKRNTNIHPVSETKEHNHIDLYRNNSYNHEYLENKRPQLNMMDFSLIDPWGDYEDEQIVEIAFDPVLSRQKRDGCSSPCKKLHIIAAFTIKLHQRGANIAL